MEKAYPNGVDCVWLAADSAGHLGAFVTGGAGPIPVQTLNSERVPVEDIEERLCSLPRVSGAHLLVALKRPDDFIALAERGLFVYDWRDAHRTARESTHKYEPVAIPLTPITVDALPEDVATLAESVKLKHVAFADRKAINVHTNVNCREGE